MAKMLTDNPNLLLKLTVTSIGLTMATAKLYSHYSDLIKETKEDIDYMNALEQAYVSSADEDMIFAEKFVKISSEADKITLELDKCLKC